MGRGLRHQNNLFDDILVEASIFGPNVMSAYKNYKRCGLALFLMYEAMARLYIKTFWSG